MPGWIFVDPNNFKNHYRCMELTDPNVPAGYILSGGTDGATDRDQQTFTPGGASGGFPIYPGDKTTVIADLKNLNGSRSPNASNSAY